MGVTRAERIADITDAQDASEHYKCVRVLESSRN